jgi:hypothetical protein
MRCIPFEMGRSKLVTKLQTGLKKVVPFQIS